MSMIKTLDAPQHRKRLELLDRAGSISYKADAQLPYRQGTKQWPSSPTPFPA
jgi:hypothetical protein